MFDDVEVEILSPRRRKIRKIRTVTFKLEEELLERLDSLARLKGVTRSELIRKAIELYLRLEEKKIVSQPKVVRLTS